jgi:hypothetical protein
LFNLNFLPCQAVHNFESTSEHYDHDSDFKPVFKDSEWELNYESKFKDINQNSNSLVMGETIKSFASTVEVSHSSNSSDQGTNQTTARGK